MIMFGNIVGLVIKIVKIVRKTPKGIKKVKKEVKKVLTLRDSLWYST